MAPTRRLTEIWSYRRLLMKARRSMPDRDQRGEQGLGLFIVSSGRSGSTLLRRMLHSNPSVSIPPESEDLMIRSLDNWFKFQNRPDELLKGQESLLKSLSCMAPWKLDIEMVMGSWKDSMERNVGFPSTYGTIYRSYSARTKPKATIHGDKTPLLVWYIDLLHVLYPKACIVHLVRNPLDAVSSLVTMDATKRDLDISIERWLNAGRVRLKAHTKPYRHRFISVKYEDLVMQPEQVLVPICDMLGIAFEPSMVNDLSQDLGDTTLKHHAAVARPVDASSIGVWRERLSKQQESEVLKRCAPTARALGYGL